MRVGSADGTLQMSIKRVRGASGVILEYSLGANPLLHELAQEPFEPVDGCIEIPERPGLGVGIDEDFVRRYAMP
jgi:L-alanine-DL-glutamate epimerase-like enolase superfamily enzyme